MNGVKISILFFFLLKKKYGRYPENEWIKRLKYKFKDAPLGNQKGKLDHIKGYKINIYDD